MALLETPSNQDPSILRKLVASCIHTRVLYVCVQVYVCVIMCELICICTLCTCHNSYTHRHTKMYLDTNMCRCTSSHMHTHTCILANKHQNGLLSQTKIVNSSRKPNLTLLSQSEINFPTRTKSTLLSQTKNRHFSPQNQQINLPLVDPKRHFFTHWYQLFCRQAAVWSSPSWGAQEEEIQIRKIRRRNSNT